MKRYLSRFMAFLLIISVFLNVLSFTEPISSGPVREPQEHRALLCAVHFDFNTTYLTQEEHKKPINSISSRYISFIPALNPVFGEYTPYWYRYNLPADHRKKLQTLIPHYFNGSKYKDGFPFC